MADCVVTTFYKFVHLPDHADLKERLIEECLERGLKGTILLAEEGINGMIAGTRPDTDRLLALLRGNAQLSDLGSLAMPSEAIPFKRLKVLTKKEIVALGMPEVRPDRQSGIPVSPDRWKRLISDPDVLLIDVRNDFEVRMGSFTGAVNPGTRSFRQFPDFVRDHLDREVNRKIAMYCTGGIRCEKASAYLLDTGFEEVYQLEGGILGYLRDMPAESCWEGECFVFDERVTVTPPDDDS